MTPGVNSLAWAYFHAALPRTCRDECSAIWSRVPKASCCAQTGRIWFSPAFSAPLTCWTWLPAPCWAKTSMRICGRFTVNGCPMGWCLPCCKIPLTGPPVFPHYPRRRNVCVRSCSLAGRPWRREFTCVDMCLIGTARCLTGTTSHIILWPFSTAGTSGNRAHPCV